MPTTANTPFTLRDLRGLADLNDACIHKFKVKWAVDGDVSVIADGVARAFTDANGNFLDRDADVRDGFIWISGMVERFMPISEILTLMADDLFVVERN